MNKIFFVADTHFGSEIAHKFTWSRHRFKSYKEVDEEIIKNWNEIVEPGDVIYHLGDFCHKESTIEDYLNYRSQLNGYIHLVRGNHDLLSTEKLLNNLFESVIEEPIELLGDEEQFWLCHYPVQRDLNYYSLVGHIHEKWRVARRMLNVGVDVNNFTPLTLEDVMFCVNAEKAKHWDANVYPDAPIDWRWEVTYAGRDVPGEPTKDIIHAEKLDADNITHKQAMEDRRK